MILAPSAGAPLIVGGPEAEHEPDQNVVDLPLTDVIGIDDIEKRHRPGSDELQPSLPGKGGPLFNFGSEGRRFDAAIAA